MDMLGIGVEIENISVNTNKNTSLSKHSLYSTMYHEYFN